jgi:HlyD family secretion protein
MRTKYLNGVHIFKIVNLIFWAPFRVGLVRQKGGAKPKEIKLQYLSIIALVLMLSSCGKKTQETKPILKNITETVFASGILEANNTYSLTAQNDGYITSLSFEEGSMVKKGQVLAVIDNKESLINNQSASDLLVIAQNNNTSNAPLLIQAQANIDITKQKMEQDALQEQRYKRLWENNSIAKIEYENSLLAYKTSTKNYETALENYRKLKTDAEQSVINNKAAKQINTVIQNKNQIKALVNGKVFEKKKEVGDFVRRGDVIAVIGDPSYIYAKINIDESSIGKIKLNQEAIVQLNTNKDKQYKATVAFIAPAFDDASQSFICKLKFVDTLDFTIVKTQLQTNIITGTSQNAILIPRNYIDFGGNVMIKGSKEPTKVTTKYYSNEWVNVIEGLDTSTVLVTDNIKATKN